MAEPGSAAATWVDIITPTMPPASLDFMPTLLLVCGSMVLVFVGIYLYNRPKSRARRELRRLFRRLRRGGSDTRHVCDRIAACLRLGLGTQSLQSFFHSTAHQPNWLAFQQRLARLRFSADIPGRAETETAIMESLHWLARRKVQR